MSNIVCAGASGGLAGIIGNPAEVVLVRMCADGAKPVGQRFMYSNVFEAFIRTAREEGIQAFGKGITANIARSVLMSEYSLIAMKALEIVPG
jgi:dicarboxylate transporter 10